MTTPKQPRADAFVAQIEKHAGILHKVARAYCPTAAERPDLIQEMMVALWRSFDRFDASRPFTTWMYRIALNVAISFYRSEDRRTGRITELKNVEIAAEAPPSDPRVGTLLECIESLGVLDKALVLLYLDGYSHGEISDVLGITATNAATKLGRIKQHLRAAMTTLANERESTHGTR